MDNLKDALLMLCGILGLVGFVTSLICVAILEGMKRATHTVQYAPVENPFEKYETDLEKINKEVDKEVEMSGRPRSVVLKEKINLDYQDEVLENISDTQIKY